MISLYDTAQSEVVPLDLAKDDTVNLYVCGPTVYDAPHIGHGRFVLVYDVFRRFLLWKGYNVNFVSNITDIDDKIIERANAEGTDIETVAKKWEGVWWETMDTLGVMRPDETPHATDYVPHMVELVEDLIGREAAYITSDGVYLDIGVVSDYGLLVNQSIEELTEGASDRDLVGSEKRNPGDFALWKLSKEGEPSWPSPWGDGRPGWHTECVVMSLDLLGEGFDLHTGGLDLKFPHHENERAQAVAAGKRFARHWMHNGFVESGGEKMSKSIGNTLNLVDLCSQYDQRAYRLLILQTHYRSPIEVTDDTMRAASASLERFDAVWRRIDSVASGDQSFNVDAAADEDILARFDMALSNDFDTVAGTELLFNAVRDLNVALDGGDMAAASRLAATFRELLSIVGIGRIEEAAVPDEAMSLLAKRDQARDAGDFQEADRLRDELAALGWNVEDSNDGARLTPR